MKTRTLIASLIVTFLAGPALGIINPKVTPAQILRASQAVLWGKVAAATEGEQRSFQVVEAVKGKAEQQVLILSLSQCKPEERAGVQAVLSGRGKDGAILFVSVLARDRRASLHVGGTWLSMRAAGPGRWDVEGVAGPMSAVYAGGTDMLLRMVRYILADPDATVPVSAGASWMPNVCEIGTVGGEIAGMETIEIKGDPMTYLHVGSSQGDRVFCARKGDEAFDEVTAELKLASRSRQFTWVANNGVPSLVSWDGGTISISTLASEGSFKLDPDKLEWNQPCLGLATCSVPGTGAAAILISTRGRPVMIHRDARGKWAQTALPDGAALKDRGEVTSACIVADLDNDGRWDVLQPRSRGGALWMGRDGGLAEPVRCAVACPDGPGHAAVGDFDQDGSLDIFLAGTTKNELWENNGHGEFRAVTSGAGTLGYKCAVGLAGCRVADLNHDGRPDLCLLHPQGAFTYHFNRGFRCFGEEGELRLENAYGQVACAVADFNADGSLDLAVACADGKIRCYYNDSFNKPLLRVGLALGVPGPVTVSVWQGRTSPQCMGTSSVAGPVKAYFALRSGRECTVKWHLPSEGLRNREVRLPQDLPGNGLEVLLGK